MARGIKLSMQSDRITWLLEHPEHLKKIEPSVLFDKWVAAGLISKHTNIKDVDYRTVVNAARREIKRGKNHHGR